MKRALIPLSRAALSDTSLNSIAHTPMLTYLPLNQQQSLPTGGTP